VFLQSLPQRFYGKEPNQIYKEITRFSKHFPKVAFPKHFSKSASSILLGLLHPIPDQRLGNLSGVSALGLLFFVVVVVDRWCVMSHPSFFLLFFQGSSDVKNHKYFADIDWVKLQQKAIKPEFIPAITDAYDSTNFKDRKDQFEKQIEADKPGAKHESWAMKF